MNVTVIKDFINNIPDDLMPILEKIEYYGFDVRIVGGAVRDLLLNKVPRDIDLASDATPDELIFILNSLFDEQEFQQIDTGGIDHGTVKVLTGQNNLYEITSLAFHIKERNQKIKIKQHRDWKKDVLRRDFTINALSLSLSGVVYDYLTGLNDLVNQRIKFIGFYKIKILMEPIMILRFAKLLTKFPEPKYNKSILNFIALNRKVIDNIKPTTLKWFLDEIRMGDYPDSATPVLQVLSIAPKLR